MSKAFAVVNGEKVPLVAFDVKVDMSNDLRWGLYRWADGKWHVWEPPPVVVHDGGSLSFGGRMMCGLWLPDAGRCEVVETRIELGHVPARLPAVEHGHAGKLVEVCRACRYFVDRDRKRAAA